MQVVPHNGFNWSSQFFLLVFCDAFCKTFIQLLSSVLGIVGEYGSQ
jgi:hypothetical protein